MSYKKSISLPDLSDNSLSFNSDSSMRISSPLVNSSKKKACETLNIEYRFDNSKEFDPFSILEKYLDHMISLEEKNMDYLKYLEDELLQNNIIKSKEEETLFEKFIHSPTEFLNFNEWQQIILMFLEKIKDTENIDVEDVFNQLLNFIRLLTLENSFKEYIIKTLCKDYCIESLTDISDDDGNIGVPITFKAPK